MKQIYAHRPDLQISADFSREEKPLFRYRLEASKVGACSNPRTVCAVMQNPSYACVEIADRSVQILERVVFERAMAEFKGIERLIVVNQFAFIQTKDFVGTNDQIGERNDQAINRAVDESEIVLIAWGKANRFLERQKRILEMVSNKTGGTLFRTSRHPSRAIYDGFVQPFAN